MTEVKVFLLGPESSGKSTLVAQLRHWANKGPEKCETVTDPSLLVVNPTTGQEVDTFPLKGNSSLDPFPQSSKLIQLFNKHCEDNLLLLPPTQRRRRQTKEEEESNFELNLPIASCFEKDFPEAANEMKGIFHYALKSHHDENQVPRNNSNNNNNSSSNANGVFHKEINLEVKEFGGRMASMWDKSISSSLASSASSSSPNFDKFIFVVDVTSPGQIPLAAIEFWKCVEKYGMNDDNKKKQFLVFINKIRCPVVMKPQDVLEGMFLTNNNSSKNLVINKLVLESRLHVIVGDTWSGEGIPLVIAWLLMVKKA